MSRDVSIFGRYWKATTFSSIVQPTIYLLAFGLGIRAFVKHVGPRQATSGYVSTGVVATAVLFSSAFPGMFNTFVRWQFQRTYDAMLAAPVDVEELITAEVLWVSIRAGVYGLAPLHRRVLLRAGTAVGDAARAADRLHHRLRLLLLRRRGRWRRRENDRQLQLRHSAVLTPMFLRRRDVLPGRKAPGGVRQIAYINPLYHCVQLMRDACFGDLHAGRPRPRRGPDRLRAVDVAARDLPARPAPDRLSFFGGVRRPSALLLHGVGRSARRSNIVRPANSAAIGGMSSPFRRRPPDRPALRAHAAPRPARAAPRAGRPAGPRRRPEPLGAEPQRLGERLLQRRRAIDEHELAQLPVRLAGPERRDDASTSRRSPCGCRRCRCGSSATTRSACSSRRR